VVNNSALEVSATSGQTQPYVVPAALPGGTVGTAYNASLGEVGGNPSALQWSVTSGALPPGLTLNASAGAIGGTPTSAVGSPFSFGVTVTDTASGHWSQTQAFTIAVTGASLSIAKSHSGNFTQGDIGDIYTVRVSNAAGAGQTSGPVTVTENLPSGLNLVSMSGTGWTCPGKARFAREAMR